MSDQTVGAVMVAVGGALLWSAWVLVVVGVLAVLLPEVLGYVRLRRARAASRAAGSGRLRGVA